jgi:hypothetical protein
MKKNIGKQDRLVRLILAAMLFMIAFWTNSWLLLFAGIFVFCESLFSWCILYQLLGKSSCPRK